jgi:hypothetical protein
MLYTCNIGWTRCTHVILDEHDDDWHIFDVEINFALQFWFINLSSVMENLINILWKNWASRENISNMHYEVLFFCHLYWSIVNTDQEYTHECMLFAGDLSCGKL